MNNNIKVLLAVVSVCFMSGKACADKAISPIRQIEVQAVDVAVPEVLLAELRRQSDEVASLKATRKNETLAANSGITAIADRKVLP